MTRARGKYKSWLRGYLEASTGRVPMPLQLCNAAEHRALYTPRLVLAMSFTLFSSSSSRADERADWGGRRRRRAQCWRAYRVHDNGGLPAGGANVAACIVACSDVSGESCDLSALSAPDSERRQKRKQHGDEDGHSHPGRLNGALLVRRGGRALGAYFLY